MLSVETKKYHEPGPVTGSSADGTQLGVVSVAITVGGQTGVSTDSRKVNPSDIPPNVQVPGRNVPLYQSPSRVGVLLRRKVPVSPHTSQLTKVVQTGGVELQPPL
jgi:hypothetical protein